MKLHNLLCVMLLLYVAASRRLKLNYTSEDRCHFQPVLDAGGPIESIEVSFTDCLFPGIQKNKTTGIVKFALFCFHKGQIVTFKACYLSNSLKQECVSLREIVSYTKVYGAIKDLEVQYITPNSATVNFTNVLWCDNTYYPHQFSFRVCKSNQRDCFVSKTDEYHENIGKHVQHQLEKLDSYTNYFVQVRYTLNSDDISEWSDAVQFLTKSDKPGDMIQYIDQSQCLVKDGSIHVGWQVKTFPFRQISHYIIIVRYKDLKREEHKFQRGSTAKQSEKFPFTQGKTPLGASLQVCSLAGCSLEHESCLFPDNGDNKEMSMIIQIVIGVVISMAVVFLIIFGIRYCRKQADVERAGSNSPPLVPRPPESEPYYEDVTTFDNSYALTQIEDRSPAQPC